MSVIAHLRIPADSFELGRIMRLEGSVTAELESMVPLGEKAVPLFSVYDGDIDEFRRQVRDHPSVESLNEVSAHGDHVVFALDWDVARDVFLQGLLETGAHVLNATGSTDAWEFELRFSNHEALGEFQEYCSNAHIPLEVGRIYNPTKPGSGQWYGLTTAQKDTLVRAVGAGYYAIPRRVSTKDLAEVFDVSDQAVTERLRRAIATLVNNTLVAAMEEEQEFEEPL